MATTETGASLLIRTRNGTARRVTEVLGIEPSDSFEIGDALGRIRPRPARHAMWCLRSPADERPLGHHLESLCERFLPLATALEQLVAEGYRMEWFCFVVSAEQGFVELDRTLLHKLARLPVDLTLDLYAGPGDDDL